MAGGMAGCFLRSDVSVYRLPFDLAYGPEPHVALGHGIGAQAAGTGGAVTIACLQRLLWKWGRDMSYVWDVFISYRRRGNMTDWVRNHLSPVLQNCLEDEMDRPPQVFVDEQLEVGQYWPDGLEQVLARSRYLLAVWAPAYFSSAWCTAEWQTMLARERVLGMPGPNATRGLIYPIVFADGDSFPEEARQVQSRFDLSRFGFPYPQFSQTPKYLKFHAKVRSIAEELAPRFPLAPPWRDDWPIHRPAPVAPPKAALPRLGDD